MFQKTYLKLIQNFLCENFNIDFVYCIQENSSDSGNIDWNTDDELEVFGSTKPVVQDKAVSASFLCKKS